MAATSIINGREAIFKNNEWVYRDTLLPIKKMGFFSKIFKRKPKLSVDIQPDKPWPRS